MDLLQAVVLGVVQGITEFVPISSSAHLVLMPWLFGWKDPGLAFDVALHIGTLLALVAYFRRDLIWLVSGWLRTLATRRSDPDGRLAWLILVATVPGVIAGVLLESAVEALFHNGDGVARARGVLLIAIAMMILGVLLGLAERRGWKNRPLKQTGLADAVLIGLSQALAIIPGVSRSGATITMGLFRGLQRDAAARFSFLLATPIIAGAGVKQVYEVARAGIPSNELVVFGVGLIMAAVTGYLCIAWLLQYLRHHSTGPFVLYRLLLGVAVIALVLVRG